MVKLFQIVLGGLVLWLLVQFFLSVGWIYAQLIAVVAALWLWQTNRRQLAVGSFLLAGLLLDGVGYPALPLNLLTSLVAGWLYIEFIEPHLSSTTSLGQLLSVGVWLLLWRLGRLLLITVVWLINGHMEIPNQIFLTGFVLWFIFGLGLWWLFQLGNRWFKPQSL